MRRTLYEPEHESFRAAFRSFLDREAVPYAGKWEQAGTPDRTSSSRPRRWGSLGDVIVPYLLHLTSEDQKERWLPRFTSGRGVTALATTQPGAGSDLALITTTARREGDTLVINGSKTFITSGATCDLAIVLACTGERDGRGTSLIVVENGTPGFERGRAMAKIGRKAQDTAELFYSDCRVPVGNLIGEPGRGFRHAVLNLPRERLSIAVAAVASVRRAFGLALKHARRGAGRDWRLAERRAVALAGRTRRGAGPVPARMAKHRLKGACYGIA